MFWTPARCRLRDEARAFAHDEVLPLADELDPRREDIPRELLDALARRGWFGITIPAEHGGLGLGVSEYCIVAEELARAWMSVASVMARGNGLLDYDLTTDEQRARYLPRVARGEMIGAFALSEEGAGSDVAAIACQATEDPATGEWVITGEKKWVGFAWHADFILLYARTTPIDEVERRHHGISAFLIEKERDAFPEGLRGEPIDKIGYFGLTTWRLWFEGLRVPASAQVGARDHAFAAAMEGLDRKRVYTAARSVGLARAGLEDALVYAARREQFGHPIAEFQSLRFRLADMAARVEASRLLYQAAAEALDAGEQMDTQAAMAKYLAAEMSERVTSDALQIHGGNGYTTEYAVQRHWRDARLTKIFEGSSEIQLRIIADDLLGRA